MTAMYVALITQDAHELPQWVPPALMRAGIALTARRCETLAQLRNCAANAEVIWTVGKNTLLTAAVLPGLTACKTIMRSGSGLDDLPVAAAEAIGIKVINTPEAIAECVAEHTVALMMALARQIPQHDRQVRQGFWHSNADWARWHVSGQTVGLIGFGLIARHVVAMLKGFNMRFLAFDPYADEAAMRNSGVEPLELQPLLSRADFVSIHCPLTPETRCLIDKQNLAHMKPEAFLINTARGAIVDATALHEALCKGRLAGAGLDVLETEPPAPDHPLLGLENVIVSPHVAAFSDRFEQQFWTTAIEKLKTLKTQWSPRCLDP